MLIGISGVASSGKDTAARYLAADFQLASIAFADEPKRICQRVYGFIDEQLWGPSELRNIPDERYPREHTWRILGDEDVATGWVCRCCGADRPVGQSPSIKQCFLTVRYALQQLGEMGRDCYRSTWIDITIRDALKLLHDPDEPCGWHYDCRYGLLLNSKTNTIPNIIRGIIFTDTRHLDEMLAVQKVEGKIIRITRPGAGLAGGPGQHPRHRFRCRRQERRHPQRPPVEAP